MFPWRLSPASTADLWFRAQKKVARCGKDHHMIELNLRNVLASPALAHVTIYTRPFCGYCARAITLLGEKAADFTEIEAGMDPAKRQEMMTRSGRSTFPQIFVGDAHIGGCDEMMALDQAGKLDAMLAA